MAHSQKNTEPNPPAKGEARGYHVALTSDQAAELGGIVQGINSLAALPPAMWEAVKQWVDALSIEPGAVLASDDYGNLTILRTNGDNVPVCNVFNAAAQSMGECASTSIN